MSAVIYNQGFNLIAQMMASQSAPQTLKLLLWGGNFTPAVGDNPSGVGTNYTETLASFTGYTSVTLTPASWTFTGSTTITASYAAQTFTSTAGAQNVNVYGYAVKQTTSGLWLFAERFSNGPYNIVNLGDYVSVSLSLVFQSP